jgi:ABC-type molybdate transport system substrate-binding protein
MYGKQVELLRNFPVKHIHDDPHAEHEARKSYVPAPWKSMPKDARNSENENENQKSKITLNDNITKIIFDLRETMPGDMYLTESDLHNTALKEQSLVLREYPFCYLTMVLLVPKGNPLFIDSVRNTLDKKYRLGIIDPSITGMGNAAWDIITKINESKIKKDDKKTKNKNIDNKEHEHIKIYNTIKDLLEALEQNEIDAALTWDACSKKAEKYAEIVYLGKKNIKSKNTTTPDTNHKTESATIANSESIESPAENKTDTQDEHKLLKVSIITLTIANNESHCRRFADFIISTEGQRILRRHGFVPTGK